MTMMSHMLRGLCEGAQFEVDSELNEMERPVDIEVLEQLLEREAWDAVPVDRAELVALLSLDYSLGSEPDADNPHKSAGPEVWDILQANVYGRILAYLQAQFATALGIDPPAADAPVHTWT